MDKESVKHLPLTKCKPVGVGFLGLLAWGAWVVFLKGLAFRFYIRLRVRFFNNNNFQHIISQYPRLILIANHSSHLDSVSISAAVPLRQWRHLYPVAAYDYWFSNRWKRFFSQNCLNAIPIERKDSAVNSIKLCNKLLSTRERIWMIVFPEGTRSRDGQLHGFKKGVGIFSQSTNTPVLFLHIRGAGKLFAKKTRLPKPGIMELVVGPVHEPAPIEEIENHYKVWVSKLEC